MHALSPTAIRLLEAAEKDGRGVRITVMGTTAWIEAGPDGDQCRLGWEEGIEAVAELSSAGLLKPAGPLTFRLC